MVHSLTNELLSNDGLLQYGGMEACYNTTGCTVSDEG